MSAALEIERVKAPLVIGVTGHRDIRKEDEEQLQKSVREVLTGLRDRYPSTPFILLSPLADGADRLVADVALRAQIGVRLIAPLPMPRHMYEHDFDKEPHSLDEFNRLLEQADQWFEIPLIADEAAASHPGPERNRQYEAVGKYIARESQILIALWDGTKSDNIGGTSAIVRFQTEGLPAEDECNLLPPELFPVYHILTPRVSNPTPRSSNPAPREELQPFDCEVIYSGVFDSDEEAKKYYEKTFGNLDEFNRLAAKGGISLENEAAECMAGVIRDFDKRKFSRCEAWTLRRYAVADALAMRLRKRMIWTHRALHWLVFLSFSSFVFYAHLDDHPPLALAAALVFLAAGYLTHKGARRMALDAKRLDYRAIADGCRVLLFWQLAGVKASVPDHYLSKQRTELDWIRNGLRSWGIGLDREPPAAWSDSKERLQFVLKHWVAHQCDYFAQAVHQRKSKSKPMEWAVTACLYLAIIIGLGLFVATMIIPPSHVKEPGEPIWKVGAIIAIDLFLAGGALLHHAHQRMAYSEQIKQYGRMLNIFENATESIQRLLDSGKLAGARSCIRALGQEALIDTGDWVRLLRERPLEIPHP